MTVWYVRTAVGSVRHPFNSGNDTALAIAWLVLVLAVTLSHVLLRKRIVIFIWSLGLAGLGVAMICLSGQWAPALITLWLVVLAWIYGDWLLGRMGGRLPEEKLESACLAGTIGLVMLSLVGLALLFCHRMSSTWTWTVLVGFTLMQWRSWLGLFDRVRGWAGTRTPSGTADYCPEGSLVSVLLGFVFLFNLAWALAPEIMYDGIWYHLAVPKAYLAEQGLVKVSNGYNAHLVETIFTMALALHGQIVAKLLVLAMSVLSACGVYALGRSLFSSRVGLWAAALFYSTPFVSWLSCTTYNDLVVALFVLAALLAFFRWRKTRVIVWLLAVGFLGGAALGAKLSALFGLPVIGFLLIMDLLRAPELSIFGKLKTLAGCVLAAALVAAPYYLIVYAFTGNPFFPLLSGLFSTGSLSPATNLNATLTPYTLGSSPFAFLRLPFLFTFESQRFGEALPSGGLGIALAFLPLALLIMARRNAAVILFAICAVFLALLGYTMPYGRYYIVILPLVAVLSTGGVMEVSSAVWFRRFGLACLAFGFMTQVAVTPVMFWNIPERVPVSLVLGSETREAFLTRALPLYRAVQYINRNCAPGEKILSVFGHQMRFYAKIPMEDVNPLSNYLRGSTAEETAAGLARDGFVFLLAPRATLETRRRLFRPPPFLRESFLTQFAELEYAADNTYVYRFRQAAAESVGERNRLPNPSFELKNASGLPADWEVYGQPPRVVENPNQAHTGQVSILVNSTGGLVSLVPVQGDKLFSLGHWARADLPEQDGRVQINWLDANENVVDVSIIVFRATPKWTWHQISASAPSKASFAQIYLSVHENSEVFFDDYVFVQGQLQAPK